MCCGCREQAVRWGPSIQVLGQRLDYVCPLLSHPVSTDVPHSFPTSVLFSDKLPQPRIACLCLSLQDPAHVLSHLFTHLTGTVTNTEINMYFLSSLGSLLPPGLTPLASEQLEAGYCVLTLPGVPSLALGKEDMLLELVFKEFIL